MCRTVHSVLQTLICVVQMLVRVLMTIILMVENLIRLILQTLYNFISFVLQLLALLPICVVFVVSARLKCFMCGGGGGCPANRGGACDCVMSLIAIVILFFIFRAAGIMDKVFYSLGYAKAHAEVVQFVPTPGDITKCSRNDSEYVDYVASTTEMDNYTKLQKLVRAHTQILRMATESLLDGNETTDPIIELAIEVNDPAGNIVVDTTTTATEHLTTDVEHETHTHILTRLEQLILQRNNLTTILYS